MTYEILLYAPSERPVIAKLQGWAWSDKEKSAPFEIVSVSVEPANEDFNVSFSASWGLVTVLASWIDSALIPEPIPEGGE